VVVPVVVLAALAGLGTWALKRSRRKRAAQRRAAAGLAPAGADKDTGQGGDALDIEAGLDPGPRGGGSSVAVSGAFCKDQAGDCFSCISAGKWTVWRL
jgi:hypothetical protein